MAGGRRRKNAKRIAALATKVDEVPDEVLGLIFLRLTSPRDLVRAAFTCRRWRQVIAGDGFRVFCSLHGAPSSHVTGHYRVEEGHTQRPPGSNPVFVPSSSSPWASIVTARSLGLDFLPRTEYGDFYWEITDARDGLLILLRPSLSRLIICDPLARRYRHIPPSAWFHGCNFMGAFLLDGEDAGARISLSNFRVTCALYNNHHGTARACAFSSAGRGRWTSGSTLVCAGEYWKAMRGNVRFTGCGRGGSVAYWTLEGVRILLALDKEAAELSSSVLQDDKQYAALRGKSPAPKYAYKLPWPLTIRACL